MQLGARNPCAIRVSVFAALHFMQRSNLLPIKGSGAGAALNFSVADPPSVKAQGAGQGRLENRVAFFLRGLNSGPS